MEQEIREELFKMQDLKYKQFNSSICPNTENIIGVRVPLLRSYAKQLIKKYRPKDILKSIGNKYNEELMLQGMIIGIAKLSIEETFEFLKTFIPKINNWAICDNTCCELKITKKYKQEMWDLIIPYINANSEFEVRFGLVIMLNYYITDEYIEKILEIVNNVKQEDYYVKMAIAWLISMCYVKQKDKTISFLHSNCLDKWTYNKSLQKIIESYRVSEDEKETIRKMKRVDF